MAELADARTQTPGLGPCRFDPTRHRADLRNARLAQAHDRALPLAATVAPSPGMACIGNVVAGADPASVDALVPCGGRVRVPSREHAEGQHVWFARGVPIATAPAWTASSWTSSPRRAVVPPSTTRQARYAPVTARMLAAGTDARAAARDAAAETCGSAAARDRRSMGRPSDAR
jgi:hypothetical protein